MNILFLCTGNSCRSIIAEALFKSMAPSGMTVGSAGSMPAGFVNPRALAVLAKAGIATEGLFSKSWNNLPEKPDVVITLCGDTFGEVCPLYFGNVIRSHWGMPDPALVHGDAAVIAAAFADTMAVLHRRIFALVKQFEIEPGMNATRLKTILDNISVM